MYSPDGTQVTLYLDGVGVPVTQQQRAITTDTAKMAHDFYEVAFLRSYYVVTRARWEIGQSTAINGVYTGPDGAGYSYFPSWGYGEGGVACLFAGRKTDRTLLAVGMFTHIDGRSVAEANYTINSLTKSVTFTLYRITTRLELDLTGDWDFRSSFFTASGQLNYYTNSQIETYPPYSYPVASFTIAEKVSLGGVEYPYYKLPKDKSVKARYRFFLNSPHKSIVVVYKYGSIKPEVIKREPRFLSGEQYHYVRAKIDTGTTVKLDWNTEPFLASGLDADGFIPHHNNGSWAFSDYYGLHFIFDTSESQGGIFSFTFRLPVCNINSYVGSSSTPDPSTVWYLQPGFGRDLFSLDNGVDNAGGCILMGTEDFDDVIEIYTK